MPSKSKEQFVTEVPSLKTSNPVVCRMYMSPISISSSSFSSILKTRNTSSFPTANEDRPLTSYRLQTTAFVPHKDPKDQSRYHDNYLFHIKRDFDEITERVNRITRELNKFERVAERKRPADENRENSQRKNVSFRLPDIIISDEDANLASFRFKEHISSHDENMFTPFRYSTPSFLRVSKSDTNVSDRASSHNLRQRSKESTRSSISDLESMSSLSAFSTSSLEPPRNFLLSPTRSHVQHMADSGIRNIHTHKPHDENTKHHLQRRLSSSHSKGFPVISEKVRVETDPQENNGLRSRKRLKNEEGNPNTRSSVSGRSKVKFQNGPLTSPVLTPLNSKSHGSSAKTKVKHQWRQHDPKDLAMKMSLPCQSGCCYCVYTTVLGPVKVYFRRTDRPKKEAFLGGIKDGNGRPAIPVSRKCDVRGLVYDRKTHSLHPPGKGQRPMFKDPSQGMNSWARGRTASTRSKKK